MRVAAPTVVENVTERRATMFPARQNANSVVPRRWVPGGRRVVTVVLAATILAGATAADARGDANSDEANTEAVRMGMLIRVTLPVDGHTVERAEQFVEAALERAKEAEARPVLIFRFEVRPDQEEFARSTNSMDALKLARLIGRVGRDFPTAQTVAYVPEAITGHAVLAAVACDQIMMPAEAEFGPVGAEPDSITATERTAYTEIANNRRTVPVALALWMLDPSMEVLRVGILDGGTEFLTRQQLDERELVITSEEPLSELTDGPPGQLTGQLAWELGVVGYLPERDRDVAERLRLPPGAMNEDPSLVAEWQGVLIDVRGPINDNVVSRAQSQIQKRIDAGANFLCLQIESGGGAPLASAELAKTLANRPEIRTVAFVPSKARCDAALIALACDDLLMRPDAELGGSGESQLSDEEIADLVEMIRNREGPWKSRSWSLVAAMIDPSLVVYRCRQEGDEDRLGYYGDAELAELAERPGAKTWQKDVAVTPKDLPLLVDGEQAVEFGLANRTVDSLVELQNHYHLKELPHAKPGWADKLIEALASPGVSAVLLTIAFVALYVEMSAPGTGLGAFVATVCFLLFFWAHYLGGTADWLEGLLFIAGVCFLLLEIFVLPGFGIFGLGGGCLVLISLVLASQTFVLPQNDYQLGQLARSLVTVVAAGVGIGATALVIRRWLPRAPILSDLMLNPPEGDEAEDLSRREALVDYTDFVGRRGKATTQLTPGGKARFGDVLVDVISDGDVIAAGSEVEVVDVHGNRVVVEVIGGK